MQYILTEKEYNDLLNKGKKREDINTKELQELCTLAAEHVPVKWGWGEKPDPKPWGCIIPLIEEAEREGECIDDLWYCDKCPAQKMCPYEWKEYSK